MPRILRFLICGFLATTWSKGALAGANVDLTIVKSASIQTASPGDQITYTLDTVNDSVNAASNVTVADILPTHTTFVSSAAPAGFTTTTPPPGGTGTVTYFNPTFASNATASFSITVEIDADTPEGTTIANTGTISTSSSDEVDPSDNNSLANVQVVVCGNGNLVTGEACDDGNLTNGDCCDDSCQFESAGGACDDGDASTSDDQCDGAGACLGTPPASPSPSPTIEPNEDFEGGGCALGRGQVSGSWHLLGFSILALAWRALRSRGLAPR